MRISRSVVFLSFAILCAIMASSLSYVYYCNTRVDIVIWTPTAKSLYLQKNIAKNMRNSRSGFRCRKLCAYGDTAKLDEIIRESHDKAALLISVGSEVAVTAESVLTNTPMVYCSIKYAETILTNQNVNVCGVLEETPVKRYIDLLRKIKDDWGDVGVMVAENDASGYLELIEFEKEYKKVFNGNLQMIVLDAKTCASITDVIQAYNFISNYDVELFYLIDDGNVSKFMGTVMRLCAKRNIPVIGGSKGLVRQGSMFVLEPDKDERVNKTVQMALSILSNDQPGVLKIEGYEMHRNEVAIATYKATLKATIDGQVKEVSHE